MTLNNTLGCNIEHWVHENITIVSLISWLKFCTQYQRQCDTSILRLGYTDRLSIKYYVVEAGLVLYQLETGVKCWEMLPQIINSNKVQNTGNTTSKHGYSTLGDWCTCKCMRTFLHCCKYFSAPKIRTVKQVNIMCEQTSSPASCLVPDVEICGNKCF